MIIISLSGDTAAEVCTAAVPPKHVDSRRRHRSDCGHCRGTGRCQDACGNHAASATLSARGAACVCAQCVDDLVVVVVVLFVVVVVILVVLCRVKEISRFIVVIPAGRTGHHACESAHVAARTAVAHHLRSRAASCGRRGRGRGHVWWESDDDGCVKHNCCYLQMTMPFSICYQQKTSNFRGRMIRNLNLLFFTDNCPSSVTHAPAFLTLFVACI